MDYPVESKFVEILLNWYSKNKCNYPWRYTKSPFLVLLSEFFLQQTKAEDVVKYYNLIVAKYRNIYELAHANLDSLEYIFSKLGLFYRAERLLSASKFIISELGGIIPNDLKKLLSIPGIGNYSANAILCFGFDYRVGIIDANIIRIYSRVFNLKSSSTRPRNDKNFWKFANDVLPKKKYLDYNYALLDFGKLVCSFKMPKCSVCPLNEICLYYTDISQKANVSQKETHTHKKQL